MKKALIIDDMEDFRNLCTAILDHFMNVEVLVAEDGEEGLAKMLKENPDVTLVDYLMPKKDGVELVREAREKGFKKKIILVTAAAMEFQLEKIVKEFDDVIIKPFGLKEFSEKVGRHLQ